jgi:hypothetical protein
VRLSVPVGREGDLGFIYDNPGAPGTTSSNYDVTADGRRFLMIKDEDQDSNTSRQMVVVLGWVDEVTRSGVKS